MICYIFIICIPKYKVREDIFTHSRIWSLNSTSYQLFHFETSEITLYNFEINDDWSGSFIMDEFQHIILGE